MPAFFAVAGFFCALCFARDPRIRKLCTRLMVFAVPFVTMMLTLQPLQHAMKLELQGSFAGFGAAFWGDYFRDGEYVSHLWFLLNLVFYYLAAWLILPRLAGKGYLRGALMVQVFRHKTLMSLIACASCLPLIVVLKPLALSDAYGAGWVVRYAPFFIVGAILYRHAELYEEFKRPRPFDVVVMAIAVGLWCLDLDGRVGWVVGLLWFYQCGFVLTGLCMLLFSRFLNRESRVTRLISDSSYTIYLFHHILVVLVATWAARHLPQAGAGMKYAIVVCAVLALTIGVHQLLIRRVALLRFLFNGWSNIDLLTKRRFRNRSYLRKTELV
jgi:glucan biosynthesis protein C